MVDLPLTLVYLNQILWGFSVELWIVGSHTIYNRSYNSFKQNKGASTRALIHLLAFT